MSVPTSHMPPEWRVPENGRDNFNQCSGCHWWYDLRDFNALMYHAYRGHSEPQREIVARNR
jgi:hypothetical protein